MKIIQTCGSRSWGGLEMQTLKIAADFDCQVVKGGMPAMGRNRGAEIAKGEWLAAKLPMLSGLGGPIFIATGLFMAATAIALVVSWTLTRTLPIMPLVSGVVVFVFGGLTLWLQDATFIKMKPTIVNTLFGGVLLGGLFFGRSLLGYVFDSAFRLDAEG